MPTLTIDGRSVFAAAGDTILEAARSVGIAIPTLCHHEALEPWGGCRLCLVDVTRSEWDGWHKAVVSCMARVEEGLQVDTQSERILAARRVALDLLLARCPDSSVVRQLAAEHGIDETTYRSRPEPDDCILCGLCTRVCEAYATSAIATWGRGTSKAVGTFGHEPPADCVGCGACAMVCPTGHIRAERSDHVYRIWERSFPTAHCTVDQARCVGCGCCEEACPFSVPRVALHANGEVSAVILPAHCRGCGACVGACPTGAIEQRIYDFLALAGDQPDDDRAAVEHGADQTVTIMSCGRSNLSASSWGPDGLAGVRLRLLDVPCSGRATAAILLARMAQGDRGALILGRHQATCRLNGAEGPAVDQVDRAQRLLSLVGVDPQRVQFLSPDSGRAGPRQAVARFVARLEPRAARDAPAATSAELGFGEGLDGVLTSLARLSSGADVSADGRKWLTDHDLPPATERTAVLYAGAIPYLWSLGPDLWRPTDLVEPLRAALRALATTSVDRVGVRCGGLGVVPASLGEQLGRAQQVFVLGETDRALLASAGVEAERLDVYLREHGDGLRGQPDSSVVACHTGSGAAELLQARGFEIVDLGPDPLPDRFALAAADRQAAAQQLRFATERGASALAVAEPAALARWALLTRVGSWQSSRLRLVMPHQLVATELGSRTLFANGSS